MSPNLSGSETSAMAATISHQSRPQTHPSCERCKRLKSRCDRQRPSCKRCLDAEGHCTYPDRRRPGFPAGYRQGLEAKIRTLEAQVLALSADPAPALPGLLQLPHRQQHPQELSRPPLARDINTVVDDGRLSDDRSVATSRRTRRVIERTPPADLVCSLVALFFRHFHPWLPLLDAESVLSSLACRHGLPLLCYALFAITLPFSFDPRLVRTSADSYWKYVKRRIFIEILEEPSYESLEALVILVLDLSGMTHGPQVWGALAIAVKLSVQLRIADDRVLRRVTRDDSDDDNDNNNNGGTGKETPNSPGRAPQVASQVGCQRLFWVIYSLDSYISIAGSQPTLLAEAHVIDFLPSREPTWCSGADDNSPQAVFYHQLRLLDVGRQIHAEFLDYAATRRHTTAYSSGDRPPCFIACASSLNAWHTNLPLRLKTILDSPALCARSAAMSAVVTLVAYYHALRIFLYSMMEGTLQQDPEHQVSAHMYRQQCAEAVKALVQIVTALHTDAHDKLGWPFSWAVWVATRYTIVLEHKEAMLASGQVPGPAVPNSSNGPISLRSLSDLDTLMSCLEMAANYQQVSAKYLWLAQRAREELLSSYGMIATPGGVLYYLQDLRVATSDLEDRFRCDPFFGDSSHNETEAAAQHPQNPYAYDKYESVRRQRSQQKPRAYHQASHQYQHNTPGEAVVPHFIQDEVLDVQRNGSDMMQGEHQDPHQHEQQQGLQERREQEDDTFMMQDGEDDFWNQTSLYPPASF